MVCLILVIKTPVKGINESTNHKSDSNVLRLPTQVTQSVENFVDQVNVELESRIVYINQDVLGNVTVRNNRQTPEEIIVILSTDSEYLLFNLSYQNKFNLSRTIEQGASHTFHFSLRPTLPSTIISGVQHFNVTAYYENVDPLNRLTEAIDNYLTVISSFNELRECLSKNTTVEQDISGNIVQRTKGSVSDPQYDNFTIYNDQALGLRHHIWFDFNSPFGTTWFVVRMTWGIFFNDPENDTLCHVYPIKIKARDGYDGGLKPRYIQLTLPQGFVGAYYKLEISLAFGEGQFSNDSRIVERGRTKVALQVKIGYDQPIQFRDPTYVQEGDKITITLPFEATNNLLSLGAELNSLSDFSPEMIVFGFFDFASNEIFRAIAYNSAFEIIVTLPAAYMLGPVGIPMVVAALWTADILLTYFIVASYYQEQRTSGNINGFEIPLVLGVIVLLSLMTKKKRIKSQI